MLASDHNKTITCKKTKQYLYSRREALGKRTKDPPSARLDRPAPPPWATKFTRHRRRKHQTEESKIRPLLYSQSPACQFSPICDQCMQHTHTSNREEQINRKISHNKLSFLVSL